MKRRIELLVIWWTATLLLSLCCEAKLSKPTVEHLGSYPRDFKSKSQQFYNSKTLFSDGRKRDLGAFKSQFVDRGSRVDFIRKVYSIFSAQTLTTFAVTALVMTQPSLSQFLFNNIRSVVLLGTIGSLAASMSLISIPNLRFRHPHNLIVLGVYTILQSLVVGAFCTQFDPRLVCLGSLHTAVVFVAMTAFAFQPNPRYDLTPFGSFLLTALTSLVVGTFLSGILRVPLHNALISGVSAALMAAYVAYDTQLIVGGKHKKRQLDPSEYVLAALGLYQDVITLFLHILKLIDELSGSDSSNRRRRRKDTGRDPER